MLLSAVAAEVVGAHRVFPARRGPARLEVDVVDGHRPHHRPEDQQQHHAQHIDRHSGAHQIMQRQIGDQPHASERHHDVEHLSQRLSPACIVRAVQHQQAGQQQGLEHGPVQRKDLGEAPHLEECRRGGGIHEAAFTTWS